MEKADPYWKLRVESGTPPDELCRCGEATPIALQEHLSPVPIACLRCNGEIPPERIGFTEQLAEEIAFWRNLHRALMTLWLDSGEYEAWARDQLENPFGQVNVSGLDIVRELNAYRRTYYWWFQDNLIDQFLPLSACPRCGERLAVACDKPACEACSIILPDNSAL